MSWKITAYIQSAFVALILKHTQTPDNALTNWSLNTQVFIDVMLFPLLVVFFIMEMYYLREK